MRLVRILIWIATLFFVAMLFVPLIQEVFRRAGTTSQVP
jgi:hypothetical protein